MPATMDETRLDRLYRTACGMDTDIHEHLPTLRRLASGCDHVTELGTRTGSSTLALLAARPERLITYDLMRWPQVDHLEALAAEAGVDFTFRQEDSTAAPIDDTDLLFIDTWHVEEQLARELALHAPMARRYVVLHDTAPDAYGDRGETRGHRGLLPAVDAYLQRGTFEVAERHLNNNGLLVLRRARPESQARAVAVPPPARVFLAFPYYQHFVAQCVDAYDGRLDPHSADQAPKWWSGGAFHDRTFNDLWCAALNSRGDFGWTHFAMCHSDVRPEGYWLSTLLRVLRETGADLASVLLPIKSAHGLSSTATLDRATGTVRRVTMREAQALPLSFGAEALPPGHDLLASTGLWCCRFDEPWVERVWFESRHRIVREPDGRFVPQTVSEDWAFSHALARLGKRVVVTREVPAGHWGTAEYRNDEGWGVPGPDPDAAPYGGWYDWQAAADAPPAQPQEKADAFHLRLP